MSAVFSMRALSPSARAVLVHGPNGPFTPTKAPTYLLAPSSQELCSPFQASDLQLSAKENSSTELRKDLSALLNGAFRQSTVDGARSPSRGFRSPFSSPLYNSDREKDFLGCGTFGEVTLCRYKNHKFALKIIRQTTNVGERNFMGVSHVNLVKILGITEIMDRIFICMEFAGHCNLANLLHDNDIYIRRRISFAQQIATGLQHCHEHGIIHGDVKPSNVIVSPFGLCKLGDFGLSVRVSSLQECSRFYLRGTAAYAAPEVLQSSAQTTAADVYSFGITMWHIYFCEIPFFGLHPHVIIYKVVRLQGRPPLKTKPDSQNVGSYINLMQRCWLQDAHIRPSSLHIVSNLEEISLQLRQYGGITSQ